MHTTPPKLPLITLCGWCPNKEARDAAALERAEAISHDICPLCLAREFGHLFATEITPEPQHPARTVHFTCRPTRLTRAHLSPITAAAAA